MAEKICEMNMTVEKDETGANATGHIEFHGSNEDKCIVLAHFLEAIEFPQSIEGMLLLLDTMRFYERNMSSESTGVSVSFVEEAEEWH